MTKSKTLPGWAQWCAGLALLAVALTAGALSLAVNVIAGLGVGLAVAVAYGLADCGKLLLPIVCRGIGWNIHTGAAYVTVSLVSVLCACLYLADANGGELLQREHKATVQADNAKQIGELEEALATQRARADAEAADGGCGTKCRAHQARADQTAQALREARKARADAGAGALPGSAMLAASLAGSSGKRAARSIAIAKSIAALTVMELLAHLAGAAAGLLGLAMQRREVAAEPAAKPVARSAKQPASGTRAYYLARLDREHPAIARRVHAGQISVHRASIEAGLRKAPAKSKWTKIDTYMKPELAEA